MSNRKNQHFVPQFYLRNFSVDKKTVSSCLIKTERLLESVAIKSQCSKNFFYPDLQYEENLGKFEAQCQRVIRKVLNEQDSVYTNTELNWLRAFLILQKSRTEHEAQIVKNCIEKMREYLRSAGMTEELERAVDSYANDEKQAVAMLASTFSSGLIMTSDVKCKFLRYNGNGAFLTSDDPVVMYNPFLEIHGKLNYGLSALGLLLVLPLSDRYAVILYDGEIYKIGHRKEHVVVFDKRQDLDWLNLLIVLHANNAVYYKPGTIDQLSVISTIKKAKALGQTKEMQLQSYLAEDGRSELLHTFGNNIYIGAHFSFIKTLDKARGFRLGDSICVTDYSRPFCNSLIMSHNTGPDLPHMTYKPK